MYEYKIGDTVRVLQNSRKRSFTSQYAGGRVGKVIKVDPHFGGGYVVTDLVFKINDYPGKCGGVYFDEIELVLPEKWCVKLTTENYLTIAPYTYYVDPIGYHHSDKITTNNWAKKIQPGYTEITYEQFKEFILKENAMKYTKEYLIQNKVAIKASKNKETALKAINLLLQITNTTFGGKKYVYEVEHECVALYQDTDTKFDGTTCTCTEDYYRHRGYEIITSEEFIANTDSKKIKCYKLLKDLPGVKAGALSIYEPSENGSYHFAWGNDDDNYYSYTIDEISDTNFFEPIYESGPVKFIINCKDRDDNDDELVVNIIPGKSIYFEDTYIYPCVIKTLVKNVNHINKNTSEINGWKVELNYVDIGCKKQIPVDKLQEGLNIYYGK